MPTACHKCNTKKCPKYPEIKDKEKQIRRILKGYKSDKDFWRGKLVKWLAIACGILLVELILVLAKGKDGIMLGFELILKIVK